MMFQMTIADVLRHEGGMPVLSQQINIEDCFPENIQKNNANELMRYAVVRLILSLARGWKASMRTSERPNERV